MNQPSRSAIWSLGPTENRVEVIEDTKIPNAATFTINKEDHTLASMLRSQLLLNESVIFAGYKVPHPLEPKFILKIQTDGSETPVHALDKAAYEVIVTLDKIRQEYNRQCKILTAVQGDQGDGDMGGFGDDGGF